jgi:hypothetical protein
MVEIDVDEKWVIPAKTSWPDAPSAMTDASTLDITIRTTPSGFENLVTLAIDHVTPEEPATGDGVLTHDSSDVAVWHYDAFTEAKTQKHPVPKAVHFVATINGGACATEHITVSPVFRHLASPMLGIYTQDRENAWKYARWKYDIDTSNLDSISYNASLGERGLTTGDVWGGNYCELGPESFALSTGSENLCASTMGHENVHGGQGYLYRQLYPDCAETEAYLWELNNASSTEISSTDISDIQDKYNYFSGRCNP